MLSSPHNTFFQWPPKRSCENNVILSPPSKPSRGSHIRVQVQVLSMAVNNPPPKLPQSLGLHSLHSLPASLLLCRRGHTLSPRGLRTCCCPPSLRPLPAPACNGVPADVCMCRPPGHPVSPPTSAAHPSSLPSSCPINLLSLHHHHSYCLLNNFIC